MEPAVGSSEGEVWRSGLLSECPAEVHAAVLEFSAHRPDRRRHLAVAAGSGQVAAALAPLFARVISRGAAPEHHLELPTNATHLLMALEGRLPAAVPEGGVDLLMADLHWLDPPTFFREARRVLAPSGALAAWGYDAPIVVSPPGRMLDPVALAHLRRSLEELWQEVLAAGGKPEGEGWEGLGMEPAPEGFGTVRRLELRQERTTSINGVRPDPLAFLARQMQAGLGIDDPCDPAALRLAWPLCVVLARDPASLRPASPGSAPRPGTPAPA